ncbi:MAG: TetR/AcrR family transcriptional regulator [Acidimicrobiales bacterium]
MVAAAVALVEKEGPTALTMRRLATDLDVTTTTIYWHVGGRDELVTEIIRHQAERLAARPVEGATPRHRVMSAARHVWDSALENPAITSLAYQTGTISLLEHPLELALVRELEAAGVTGRPAADALRSILTTVGGFLVLALRDDSAIPEERRSAALWSAEHQDVGADTLAALTRPTDLPALFETTVQAVVDHHVPDPI